MILDQYKLESVITLFQYDDAFEIWDNAGKIAKQLSQIWPGLKPVDARPQLQTLKSSDVQISVGIKSSTITTYGEKAVDSTKIRQITDTFSVLKHMLNLEELERVSTRSTFVKTFKSIGEANTELLSYGLVNFPEGKVFGQSENSELNGYEVLLRFQDKDSFSNVVIKSEKLTIEADFGPEYGAGDIVKSVNEVIYRSLIDFDRGVLNKVSASRLLIDDWFKGYFHVLRRDFDKIVNK